MVAPVCAVQAREGRPCVGLRAYARLTVRGARPNTRALIRSAWPWATPTLTVSRSAALMCRENLFVMATP